MLIYGLAFLVIGGILFVAANAANPTANVQPETGNLNGNVSICSDSNASGGKCVQFGGYVVVNVPSNISSQATCSGSLVDVTQQIETWLMSLPAKTIARFGKDRCYRLEYTLTLEGKTKLIIDGNGATFDSLTDGCNGTRVGAKQFTNCKYPAPADVNSLTKKTWPQGRQHIVLTDVTDLTLKNLKIDGGKAAAGYSEDYAFQSGVYIKNNSRNVLLDRMTIDHVWGDFITMQGYTNASGQRIAPTNITVQNGKFGTNSKTDFAAGRQEIAIDDGSNIHIQYNTFTNGSRSTVDIEPVRDEALLQNIYFDHNTFGYSKLTFFANNNYGNYYPKISGVYFRYNTLKGRSMNSISTLLPTPLATVDPAKPSTYRRTNYQFIGNTATDYSWGSGNCGDPQGMFTIMGVDGVVFKDNVLSVKANQCVHLIEGTKLRNVQVINNTVSNAKGLLLNMGNMGTICATNNKIGTPLALVLPSLFPACS